MSFTRPTISASGALRAGLALAIAAFAAFAAYGSIRDLLGGRAFTRGHAALQEATLLPRGAARDRALRDVQKIADEGVDLAPDDPNLWNLLAETRLMQATTAAIEVVSNDLLNAAEKASARAASLAPNDPAPPARIAFAKSLRDGNKSEVGAALAHSYAVRPFDPDIGLRRLEAAGRAWTALSDVVRKEALLEACQLARQGKRERDALYELRMGSADPGMALAIDAIMIDPSCAIRG